jgi:hypothetical protein
MNSHPNMKALLWPDSTPAGKFSRLVREAFPSWVWVVFIRHSGDPCGGIYLGPMTTRELADECAAAVEAMKMPGLAVLSVERKDGHDVPLEFADDTDWREMVRCLRRSDEVHRVAWLVDYLMRGGR